jgi:hypothetical protein
MAWWYAQASTWGEAMVASLASVDASLSHMHVNWPMCLQDWQQ